MIWSYDTTDSGFPHKTPSMRNRQAPTSCDGTCDGCHPATTWLRLRGASFKKRAFSNQIRSKSSSRKINTKTLSTTRKVWAVSGLNHKAFPALSLLQSYSSILVVSFNAKVWVRYLGNSGNTCHGSKHRSMFTDPTGVASRLLDQLGIINEQ